MRYLAVLLLTLCLPQAHTQASDWSATIKQVEPSIVFVQNERGSCTGFVVNRLKHYVMTAGHCYGFDLWADHSPAEVVARDPHGDIMIAKVKYLDPARPALHLALRDPLRGQEVMAIGHANGWDRPEYRVAHIADNRNVELAPNGPFLVLDNTIVHGQSGGPIINMAGEVVGINQLGSDTEGAGIGAEQIRQRLGRFFQ